MAFKYPDLDYEKYPNAHYPIGTLKDIILLEK